MEETLIDKDVKRKRVLSPQKNRFRQVVPGYTESYFKSNEEPGHPSEKVSSQIRQFLQLENSNDQSNLYLQKLISTLTIYTGLTKNKIIPFTGINQALETSIKAFTSFGDEILICGPQFDTINDIAGRFGATTQYQYAPSPFASDMASVATSLTEKTRLIYLSSPNPITGTAYLTEEIKYLLDCCSDSLVLLDESLYEYYQMSAADLVNQYDNLVILRTFSAGFELRGVACDYVLSSDKNIDILKLAYKSKYSASSLAAALFTLRALDFEQRRWASIRENMVYLSTRLRSFGISCRMTPTNFILVYANNTDRMHSFILSKKIIAQNLKDISHMEKYIALAVSDDNSSANIIECFRQMPRAYYSRTKSEYSKLVLKKRCIGKTENLERTVTENEYRI